MFSDLLNDLKCLLRDIKGVGVEILETLKVVLEEIWDITPWRQKQRRQLEQDQQQAQRMAQMDEVMSTQKRLQVAEWSAILHVSEDAGGAQVKTAYRKLMRKHHPDLNAESKQKSSTEKAIRLTEAYDGLIEHLQKSGRHE